MAKQPKKSIVSKRAQAKKQRAREVIHKAAQLKKRGLIYQGTPLRGKTVTDYMRRRVRELEGVLEGRLQFIEVPKPVATKYQYEGGLKRVKKGKRRGVLVPTPIDGSTLSLDHARGLIRQIKPLGSSGHVLERILMPVNIQDVEEFLEWIDSGEPDRLKYPGEYFGLRIYGNASMQAIPNSETLSFYIRTRYERLLADNPELSPSDQADVPMALELFRVWPPEAWEDMAREELAAYHASDEYREKTRLKRERTNRQRRVRRYKKRQAALKSGAAKEAPPVNLAALIESREAERKRKAREKKRKQRSRKK